jgi:hypothetical protein
MATKIHVANSKPRAFEQRIQSAEDFVRHVLENKKFFHDRRAKELPVGRKPLKKCFKAGCLL